MSSNYDGLSGAVVSKVKVEVEYAYSHSLSVLSFVDHTALNNWLMSPSVRGKVRVRQVLIRYDYNDENYCI